MVTRLESDDMASEFPNLDCMSIQMLFCLTDDCFIVRAVNKLRRPLDPAAFSHDINAIDRHHARSALGRRDVTDC
jgi:hypothetical protein